MKKHESEASIVSDVDYYSLLNDYLELSISSY